MGPFGSEVKRKKTLGSLSLFCVPVWYLTFPPPSLNSSERGQLIHPRWYIWRRRRTQTKPWICFSSSLEEKKVTADLVLKSCEKLWESPNFFPEERPKFRRFLSIFWCFTFCAIFLPNHALTDRTCANNNLPSSPPLSSLYLPTLRFGRRRRRGIGTTFFLLTPPPPPFAPPVPHRTPNQEGGGKEEEEEKDPASPYLRLRSNWRRK